MPTRREFLAAAALTPIGLSQDRRQAFTDGVREIRNPLNGPIGLQLWSVRDQLGKDVPGTLSKVRAMGFREVEGAGLWGKTVSELKAAMDAAGLKCQSAHMGLERLRDDLPGALAEARALGATRVVCPWIKEKVTRDDVMKAADIFNKAAAAAVAVDMRFGYHLHGYEFVPSPDGTLMDTLAKHTNPGQVELQVDVFHVFYAGGDPAKLITQYGKRVTSLHLKDLKKGAAAVPGKSVGTADIDVPVGTGQIDMAAVLRAARATGPKFYYIEDESADPLGHVPASVSYLENIKL